MAGNLHQDAAGERYDRFSEAFGAAFRNPARRCHRAGSAGNQRPKPAGGPVGDLSQAGGRDSPGPGDPAQAGRRWRWRWRRRGALGHTGQPGASAASGSPPVHAAGGGDRKPRSETAHGADPCGAPGSCASGAKPGAIRRSQRGAGAAIGRAGTRGRRPGAGPGRARRGSRAALEVPAGAPATAGPGR